MAQLLRRVVVEKLYRCWFLDQGHRVVALVVVSVAVVRRRRVHADYLVNDAMVSLNWMHDARPERVQSGDMKRETCQMTVATLSFARDLAALHPGTAKESCSYPKVVLREFFRDRPQN